MVLKNTNNNYAIAHRFRDIPTYESNNNDDIAHRFRDIPTYESCIEPVESKLDDFKSIPFRYLNDHKEHKMGEYNSDDQSNCSEHVLDAEVTTVKKEQSDYLQDVAEEMTTHKDLEWVVQSGN